MFSNREVFAKQGFIVIKNVFTELELSAINDEYEKLFDHAKNIIAYSEKSNLTLREYYRYNPKELIVVPETDNHLMPCRFEYIAQHSSLIKMVLIDTAKRLIDDLMGESFVLFKDKCNVKNPGGGAFPPHQDIAAYYHFKPSFHITAAVILDQSNIANGCLEMSVGYTNSIDAQTKLIDCKFGRYPFFDYYTCGKSNGNISDSISSKFTWFPIEANAGDIVLFDSYVPHKSQKNSSCHKRRNFFFTFNSESEGDWYQTYYAHKMQNFDNPMFHIATPTKHSGIV